MARRILQVAAGSMLGLAVVLLALPLLTGEPVEDDPHLLPAPYPAPRVTLTDHRGETTELPGDFDGVTVVFFGYTHCPDVCPLTLANLARVAEGLPTEERSRFRAVLVTVDPARDTPERLARYVARFDPSFVGLTGGEDEVRDAVAAWGAWAQRAEGAPAAPGDSAGPTAGRTDESDPAEGPRSDADGYLVDHTARAFVVDGRGRVVATFPPATTADAMLPTVRRLLER